MMMLQRWILLIHITPRSYTTTIKITHLDLIRFLLPELLVTNLTWSQSPPPTSGASPLFVSPEIFVFINI